MAATIHDPHDLIEANRDVAHRVQQVQFSDPSRAALSSTDKLVPTLTGIAPSYGTSAYVGITFDLEVTVPAAIGFCG